jgi:plasmid stabilization system protein ParE
MVDYSEQAIADLETIRSRIALDNSRIATQKSAMLLGTCQLLDSFPDIGAVYSDPIRQFTKELWVILYRPTETGVYIYRVFDSRQDWRSLLL